jgi:hypothetical protein
MPQDTYLIEIGHAVPELAPDQSYVIKVEPVTQFAYPLPAEVREVSQESSLAVPGDLYKSFLDGIPEDFAYLRVPFDNLGVTFRYNINYPSVLRVIADEVEDVEVARLMHWVASFVSLSYSYGMPAIRVRKLKDR